MYNKNNKAYLFLSPSIVVAGGAELYMSAKCKWLQERGWDVYIAGPCNIAPILDYGAAQIIDVQLFNIRPFTMAKHTRRAIVEPVISCLKQYSRVFIESSSVTYGFWGEYISSLIPASHMIFHLSESTPELSKSEKQFLTYKHNRKEYFCINKNIFKKTVLYCDESRCVLSAKMPSVIQDINFDLSCYPKEAFRIGCISRLDKPFLYRCVSDLSKLPIDIELLLVGGVSSPNQNERELEEKIKEVANGGLRIIFTGALCPIPRKLVDTFDFGVGKAGGAFQLARHGIPTFVYSIDSDEPRGMLGFDYNRSPTSGDVEVIDLASALKRQYETSYYSDKPYPLSLVETDTDYSAHFDAFQGGQGEPALRIKGLHHRGIKEWAKGALCTVFGARRYMQITNAVKGK